MKKIVKILIIVIIINLCIFVTWFFFLKKDPNIEAYENKQNEKLEKLGENIENDNLPENDQKIENPQIVDNNSIIITSNDEVLNEKGKELLNELSKELEESLSTISSTNGIIDENILKVEGEE